MSDQEIINLLLERTHRSYPVAVAVHPVLEKELFVKDFYKYRELINKMVDEELVTNTFGDFIRILPKGKNIVDSVGYLKYLELQSGEICSIPQTVRSEELNNLQSPSVNRYLGKDGWWPLIRSLVAVVFSYFTLHR